MSDLSRDELRAVAKAATDVLRAELSLYAPPGEDTTHKIAYVTGAQVRAVVEALESAGYLLARVDAIGPVFMPKGRPIVASPRNGAYRDYSDNEKGLFPHYTPEEVAQMGDPAPFPAPEPPAAKVADDDDDDESPFADFAPDEIEDGGVTRILPRPDNSQAHSLPSAFAERNSDGRQVRPAYRTED